MTPFDALKLVASATFRPFSDNDYMIYSVDSSEALIADGPDYVVILDTDRASSLITILYTDGSEYNFKVSSETSYGPLTRFEIGVDR